MYDMLVPVGRITKLNQPLKALSDLNPVNIMADLLVFHFSITFPYL